MNELIRAYRHAIKYLFIPYLFLLFLLAYPIEYYVQSPGGLSEVEDLIEIEYNEDKVIEGSISTTFVMGIPRPTIFMFLAGYFNKYADLMVLPTNYQTYSNEEISQISYQDKHISVNAAIIVAYEAISEVNPDIVIDYQAKTMVFGKATYLDHYESIAFGDEFVSFKGDNGVIVNQISEIASVASTAGPYDFTFKNNVGETYTLALTKDPDAGVFGITFKNYYLVNSETTFPRYRLTDSNIGGPSGGLLQTLSIYNMLSDHDITHGLKIAGTGTINYDGSVGYIGGVKQKIITAYESKVDVFFIPYLGDVSYDNYLEAVNVCEAYGIEYESWLVPIASFQDAIDYLEGLDD
ncbi:MAG: S16 family serine protease [Candidatus Izemoplasmatales bacterium]|jgi:PDZ domain-containing protein